MKVIIIGGVAEGAIAPSRPDVHLPIANTLRDCPKGWMRALEGVDDAARRPCGTLDRRRFHERYDHVFNELLQVLIERFDGIEHERHIRLAIRHDIRKMRGTRHADDVEERIDEPTALGERVLVHPCVEGCIEEP